jgi:hypothetical protein
MSQTLIRVSRFVSALLGWRAWALSPLLLLALVACGGGSGDVAKGEPLAGSASRVPSQASEASRLPKYAALPRREFVQSQASTLKASLAQQKSQSHTSPVFRFFNTLTGAHFYTINEAERNSVLNVGAASNFEYEGPAFSAVPTGNAASGLSPVHRFYNQIKGVHFYTIDESERASVQRNPALKHFLYEGVAYYAHKAAGSGRKALYRFFVPGEGFHFYTADVNERDWVRENLADKYVYEGIGYYVLDSEANIANPVLPHTGVTANQCYQQGSDSLVSCAGASAIALNSQQDGHRTSVNQMSFSAIAGRSLTECVQDNVTGLVWEGKEASGYYGGSESFTNLGNGELNDAQTYVLVANYFATCGFYDWRLPTRNELLTIVNYGRVEPKFDPAWFPNQSYWGGPYLAAEPSLTYENYVWTVGGNGRSDGLTNLNSNGSLVRLVRGNLSAASRFTFDTVAFSGDASFNVVVDAKTGLHWRRCTEGRSWSGVTCVGEPHYLTHEGALSYAESKIGWRLPSVKELSSLSDVSKAGAVRMDTVAFPNSPGSWQWSSTPNIQGSDAMYVDFSFGNVNVVTRGVPMEIRLVLNSP